MSSLHLQRCRNHPDREAAARCPACSRFFCRECVAEHDHKLLCAECLAAAAEPVVRRGRGGWWLLFPVQWGMGLLVAWLCFYSLGRVLAELPDDFHEGTFWKRVTDSARPEGS